MSKVEQTYSADSIALACTLTYKVYVTGKEVRGAARGDTKPAVLARFATRNPDGSNHQHRYTGAEAWAVLRAVTATKQRGIDGRMLDAGAVAKSIGLPMTAEVKTKPTSKPAAGRKPANPLGTRAVRTKPAATAQPAPDANVAS